MKIEIKINGGASMNQFKIYREKAGLAQMAVAVKSKTSIATISAIEKHGYIPGPDLRARIAKVLRVSANKLWPELSEV